MNWPRGARERAYPAPLIAPLRARKARLQDDGNIKVFLFVLHFVKALGKGGA